MVTRSLYAGQSFKIIEREVLHGPIKGRNKKGIPQRIEISFENPFKDKPRKFLWKCG